MSYIATINVPGYLPMADDPAVFETCQEAWAYLAAEHDFGTAAECVDDETTARDLARRARYAGDLADSHMVGTVYGPTPGYDGDHDLGLAYSVYEVEDDFETLGSCGCTDYHMADCPTRGGSASYVSDPLDYYDSYYL